MATTPPLALANLISISVAVAPSAPAVPSFNQGLFIGSSAVIPSYGANSRVRQYSLASYATQMLTDGFTTSSPEYIAAQIYFSQNEAASFIWIGRQDLTAIAAMTFATSHAGASWAVGDQFTVTQGGASLGIGTVLTESGGAVETVGVVPFNQGTGYAVANGLTATAVSPSIGTGLEVDITAVGESLLQSAEYCRAASGTWYGLAVYNPADADNLALAAWADPLWQNTRYFAWSASAGIPAGTPANIALQLQTLKYRCMGIYSTTQGGLYLNNIYAASALMGLEMGLNTGLANSFFTDAYKQLVGIAVEPLTQTQYNNVVAASFNVYGNFAPYQWLQPGFASNGSPSFLWLFIAVWVANIQLNEAAVLNANPVVAQTNIDEQLLINGVIAACVLMANIGFLAGGIWEGQTFNIIGVSIANGQALPLGYSVQAQPYSQQSTESRDAGQAMPIYTFGTTAGAVQSLAIGVFVQL
jgi:hypothetical protein